MYLCEECGAVFEKPKVDYDVWLEHFGHPCREAFDCCPACGSGGIARAVRCGECGRYEAESDMEQRFCRECAKKVFKKFDDFVCTLTEEEKTLLNAAYYGADAFV